MEIDVLTEYKQILVNNLESWSNTQNLGSIEMKRLTGLTNVTYRVTNLDESLVNNKNRTVVLRIFGTVEGLVDKKKEHIIFMDLGNLGQGPKCLGYGGSWRIEEFIDEGSHPDLEVMRSMTYRRCIAKYLAQFHQVQLQDVPVEEAKIKQYINNRDVTLYPFWEKMKQVKQFSQEEIVILKQFESIASEEELDYLQSILPQSKAMLCHNDLNNLNIFYSSSASSSNRIKFIDFEYCAYNYIAFDIANFMNESHFNYNVTDDPYFELVTPNVFSQEDIIDFVHYYLAAKLITDEIDLDNFENDILKSSQIKHSQTKAPSNDKLVEQNNELPLKYASKYVSVEEFNQQCETLVFEILCCQVLSNWYWVIWSVITAKSAGMIFNHIHYGKTRYDIYQNLKLQLETFDKKRKI